MARLTPSEPLTPRQREVWRLIGRGHTNSEIANLLGISLAGAKWHVSELLGKFNAASREELAEAWHEGGIVSRMSGWAGGLLASVSLKTGLAVGATVVGVSGAAFAGAVVWSLADSSGTRATPVEVANMPTASGAKWTPQQAYDVARRQAGIALASAQLSQIDPSVRLDQMTLAALDWLPGITRWDAPDGDRYWQSGISTA